MKKYIAKAAVLIEALPYIQRFRGAVVVIKFGGSAMEKLNCMESTIGDVVFLESVGLKPVIVHGGGYAINGKLQKLGRNTHFINGLRYTCGKTMAVVDEVLHDDINPRLVNGILKWGGKPRTLSGKDILRATKIRFEDHKTKKITDIGYVGTVESVNIAKIQKILDRDEIPVITPIGIGNDGKPYNVNADIAASRIAEYLRARKLVFLSNVPGILKDANDEKSLISTIKAYEVEKLITEKIISDGMVPKLQSAVKALEAGINKVHLIDGRIQHSLLLEIFTNQGIGTQILAPPPHYDRAPMSKAPITSNPFREVGLHEIIQGISNPPKAFPKYE